MNKVTLWVRLNDLMPRDKVRDNFSGSRGAAPGPRLRTGPVRSQREFSQPFESLTPVVQLLFGGRRSQPRALPFDEMSVLEWELRQSWQAPF